MKFSFASGIRFQYDPFPIGVVKGVLEGAAYDGLLANWPALELFQFKPELGNKYSLSEVNNPTQYHQFIRSSALWRELYVYLKAPRFVDDVVSMLCSNHVDLGIDSSMVVESSIFSSAALKACGMLRKLQSRLAGRDVLNVRFEFSMLPSDGGCIKPHTDSPNKIVTLVLSVVGKGEWNPEFGGGTDVMRPRDMTRSFNHLNEYMEFDEVETISTFPFEPNQCVIFIKTFNSLHAVRPMSGGASGALRRTLTINIERLR